jgi:carbon storage regulator
MLVLSRKVGERIKVGENIWISIEEVDRGKVRVGIEAPKKIPILREEVVEVATAWGMVDLGGVK